MKRPLRGFRSTGDPPLVRHPPSVTIVAVDNGEVVLVRQPRPGADSPTLELPSGKLEPGETVEAAAARELAEETHLEAELLHAIGSFLAVPAYSTERVHVVVASGLRPHPAPPAPDADEDVVVERRPVDDLPGCLTDGTSIAAYALWRAASPRTSW